MDAIYRAYCTSQCGHYGRENHAIYVAYHSPRKSDVLPVSVLKTLDNSEKIMEITEHVDDLASSVTSMALDDTASEAADARGHMQEMVNHVAQMKTD